ncbi:MAG TPA: histone deacetylase [Terrimicrobiaceae bacterium]|nr:histone deacetylase [Terrimicrobiaceae bacterium]
MMVRTALLLDDFLKRHRTAEGHPECPGRLDAIGSSLAPLQNVVVLSSRRATLDEIGLCHDPRYVEEVLELIASGGADLSRGDVSVCEESGEVALHAAGGVLEAVDAVLIGHVQNAFCAVRPPGHHARPAAAMGFCIFNNVAIAARHAQKKHGVERVAIVDWDVHHGNGTEEIFYSDGSVLYFSTHQWPWYPGTGHASETGVGKGAGLTINCPLPAGSGRQEIFGAFRDRLLPALESYRPQLLLISAGFDSRDGDPLGQFRLHDQDFADLTRMLMDVAAGPCAGRVVSMLEGGYNLSGLGTAAKSHVSQLIG